MMFILILHDIAFLKLRFYPKVWLETTFSMPIIGQEEKGGEWGHPVEVEWITFFSAFMCGVFENACCFTSIRGKNVFCDDSLEVGANSNPLKKRGILAI